jgi:hypothetical protein
LIFSDNSFKTVGIYVLIKFKTLNVLFNLPVYILISIRIIFWATIFLFVLVGFFQSTFNTGNKYKIFYYMQNMQY